MKCREVLPCVPPFCNAANILGMMRYLKDEKAGIGKPHYQLKSSSEQTLQSLTGKEKTKKPNKPLNPDSRELCANLIKNGNGNSQLWRSQCSYAGANPKLKKKKGKAVTTHLRTTEYGLNESSTRSFRSTS
jgi:hypothetical protein